MFFWILLCNHCAFLNEILVLSKISSLCSPHSMLWRTRSSVTTRPPTYLTSSQAAVSSPWATMSITMAILSIRWGRAFPIDEVRVMEFVSLYDFVNKEWLRTIIQRFFMQCMYFKYDFHQSIWLVQYSHVEVICGFWVISILTIFCVLDVQHHNYRYILMYICGLVNAYQWLLT